MIIYSSSPHNGFNLKTAGCTTDVCEGGGTGRRARLRCVWFILGGSNPLLRTKNQNTLCSGFFVVRRRGFEQHGHAVGGAVNSPVGCLLVRGFWNVRNVYRGKEGNRAAND